MLLKREKELERVLRSFQTRGTGHLGVLSGEGRNGGVCESHTQRQCSKSPLVHLGQRSVTVLEDWTLPCHLERDAPSLLCWSGSAEQTSDWISAPVGACTYTNTIGTHPPSSQVIVLLLIRPWMDFPCVQSSLFLS